MKIYIPPTTAGRIRDAWEKLTPEQRSRILPLLQRAHQKTLIATQERVAPHLDEKVGTPLNLALTAMTGDSAGIADALAVEIVVAVDGGGEIWGTGKYEQLDAGWLEAFVLWLENINEDKPTFNGSPAVKLIDDKLTVALAGDWGTGEWRTPANPSMFTKVCRQIAILEPTLTIHLGDVYYAGTEDEEEQILTKSWPRGSKGSFALNSNHEMYSRAVPYFEAIGKAPFDLQKGCSYFALENKNWVIVGLDSAYFADEYGMYREGALLRDGQGGEQVAFLEAQAAKGKSIILLTHHNGLNEDGSGKNGLWTDVMSALKKVKKPIYWYWGHMHAGVWYDTQSNGNVEVNCRCCGHGALPCGHAKDLTNSNQIIWNEDRSAGDPDIPERVLNGFAVISLDGPAIAEKFYDENGGVAWPTKMVNRPPLSAPLSSLIKPGVLREKMPLESTKTKSSLTVKIFDGTRQPVSSELKILTTITDGNENQLYRDYRASGTTFELPFYDNLGDNYTVLAFADRYSQAGFTPIKCSPTFPQSLDIMLLPKDAGFRFAGAQWDKLASAHPLLYSILAHGAANASAAADRYTELLEMRAPVLACLFNITTAMSAIALPVGNPLQYFKEVIWDNTMAQDRFYGWADPALYDQVRMAAAQGTFSREAGFATFHAGATDSYKQIQFGEANVQLTFHAKDTKLIDGVNCVKMEPDIDYYKDLAAHTLLEVISNGLSGNLTDPRQVYVLRWIAGRHAGVPEFNPPYVIG
jgi:Calcineurin-like phosphoesterase